MLMTNSNFARLHYGQIMGIVVVAALAANVAALAPVTITEVCLRTNSSASVYI
jgi:hypothetical protein